MGILNVTPDSFSDGGEIHGDPGRALARARAMVDAGAALLDVGGESTRPGAARVSVDEELARVLPVIEALVRELPVPVSVDTRKAAVARAALAAGAAIVNDVSGLAHDPGMAAAVAEGEAGLVLMHMRGEPADMMERAVYGDVVREVARELGAAVAAARAAGIAGDAIVIDPGIGFAKTAEHSLTVLKRLAELSALGHPILVGPSRKSFLGKVLDAPLAERVAGTVAACVVAYGAGARLFRVHDVAPVVQALRVAEAIALAALPPAAAAPAAAVPAAAAPAALGSAAR
jgi:dihydropteroate synthase